ncbi:protein FAR1-RELATED SEQUENCE 5-like [Macadamia integrifolia]|uniref:protein FAR1-RELATED SEQUENCE 5-like n=1 Tax=Macadamia integrifolia TaxID=60698 RepID=UPI001C529867|nr:protein FAR1-RELATED SEQUENCE 5-like [Macadamia integrifolia]
MRIKLNIDGMYNCIEFVEEHNHELHLPSTSHLMKSQRIVSEFHAFEIDLADDSGIRPKDMFEYISKHIGGKQSIGCLREDQKNYLRTKSQRDLRYGEAKSLLLYFENQFGDVVSFDTTFSTNKESRPFRIFAGFNQHRGIIIFGAALLYDEMVDSFKFLFEVFLKAHGQKKPITIFTDQDAAMGKALTEVSPETKHSLCILHLMQKGIKHMGNMMKDGLNFLADLKKCMFHYDDESQFEIAWDKLRSDYQVNENSWLDRIYCLKYKWTKCYMKETLTIGMRSTQLGKSINGDMKDYLSSTLHLVQFFKHFKRIVADKRANELKAEFDARNKLPRILFLKSSVMNQAARVYTPKIFEKLQKYCQKFDHIFKVLDVDDFKYIPDTYILRRWTWIARNTVVHDTEGKVVVEDVHLDYSQMYRRICPKLDRIEAIASNSSEGYAYVDNVADELCKHLKTINISFNGQDDKRVLIKDIVVNSGVTLKKKDGPKKVVDVRRVG